jgi:hypothetical protein
VTECEPWRALLCQALAVLALPADEQIRLNGPGCVGCDLLNDFDHARSVAGDEAKLSDDQRRALETIDKIIRSMDEPDRECMNNEVLRRPVWMRLRESAVEALRVFSWEGTVVEPFVEVQPGVWHRVPSTPQPKAARDRDTA